TIAPESGSARLRKLMGKGLDESDIENAVNLAKKAGYGALKLYFIVGLPEETDEDLKETVEMIAKLARTSGLRVTASVNPFIPKAQTRWETEPQPPIKEIRRKVAFVERGVREISRVTVETLDPRNARIQAALSLGDRTLGQVIRKASEYGGLGGWRRAEKETKIPFFSIANNAERLEGELPWSFLNNR
ncbi:MAG: radical SAM protein, partial [Candidatus Thorarchaeota archaeon]